MGFHAFYSRLIDSMLDAWNVVFSEKKNSFERGFETGRE